MALILKSNLIQKNCKNIKNQKELTKNIFSKNIAQFTFTIIV